jgi:hypothetical protein
MARTQDDVLESMQESVEAIDPTIDTTKGPVYESMLLPWSKEGAYIEGQVEALGDYWQLENVTQLNQEKVELVGRAYAMEYGKGDPSQGYLTFWATEVPDSDVLIATGTLVSTSDGSYIYQTTEQATFYAANASAYYNSSTRRYEIKVAAEAVERGSEYDAKQGRINTLVTSLDGIIGVTNDEDFEGGYSDQTVNEFAQDLLELPLGNSLGSVGGIKSLLLRSYASSIQDLAVVTPGDVGAYERFSETNLRAAVDVYVAGSRIGTAYQSYTTVGLETTVTLEKQPALAVSSVLVNGTAASFTFSEDTSSSRRGSTSATSSVSFTYPGSVTAGAGNTVYVVYTYDVLVENLQNELSNEQEDLFNTDLRVRAAKLVPTWVEIAVSSYGTGNTKQDVEDWITEWFKDPTGLTTRTKFIGSADPEDFKEAIASQLGVKLTRLDKFQRTDLALLDVGYIAYHKNEIPDLTITIRYGS